MLHRLVDSYFRREWDRWPSLGSHAGLTEYDGRLEAPDPSLYDEQVWDARQTRRLVGELPACDAYSLEALDRRAFATHLEWQEIELGELRMWRSSPVAAPEVAVGSLFHLLVRRDASRPETVEAIRSRLERLPAYLRAARSAVADPVALWLPAAEQATLGAMAFVRHCVPDLAAQHPAGATGLERAAAAAADALQAYLEWVRDLMARPNRQDPAIGGDLLTRIIGVNHGLAQTADQIGEFGRNEVARLKRELEEAARVLDSGRPWLEILREERARFAERPHDLLREYRETTARLRNELLRREVLDLPPGETCDVIVTPAFLRPMIPSAAYSSPGPLDPNQKGIFYVTTPPEDLPRDEFRANLGQHFGLESTCAHEAYPGHHVQLCWANQASSLARKMAHHIVFMEGWTMYCEQLLLELKLLDSPLWTLDYLQAQLWRAYRIVIDVEVHTRRMTVAQAIQALESELGFTRLRAESELIWYTQSPGTPMSYLLGKHETLAVRELYRRHHPGHSLREFHRWLLGFGSVPQRWLVPYVGSER